jgi:Spy/CpxP family protein refolding chaperone
MLPVSAGGQRYEFLRRATRDLELTPAQRAQVDRVLKEAQERSRRIMEPVGPQLREELQRTKEQFRDLLTPQQRARFDEVLKQQQQRPRDQRDPRRPLVPSAEQPPQPQPLEPAPVSPESPPRAP